MPTYPQSAAGLNYITYPVGPSSASLAVISDVAADTKGAYVEFVASTPFAANQVIVDIPSSTAVSGRRFLVDIAIGGVGVESVIIPNIMAEGAGIGSGQTAAGAHTFPIAVAAGVRLSARCQCSTGSSTINVAITLIAAGGLPGVSGFTQYGANLATSGGAVVDPGGSAGTKGSYTEITASTTAIAQWLIINFTNGGNTGPISASWGVDIATGPNLSEVVLIPDLKTTTHSSLSTTPKSYAVYTYIAAGTRIAVRASSSTADATDRLLHVTITTAVAPSEPTGDLTWASLAVLGAAGQALYRMIDAG